MLHQALATHVRLHQVIAGYLTWGQGERLTGAGPHHRGRGWGQGQLVGNLEREEHLTPARVS